MTNEALRSWLEARGACIDAKDWLGDRDLATALIECPCGDWLLWFLARVGWDRTEVMLMAAHCAAMALRHVTAVEQRTHEAMRSERRWTLGRLTPKDAAESAEEACRDADAAGSAADAWRAAWRAASAAWAAADTEVEAVEAREAELRLQADMIRRRVSVSEVERMFQ